VTWQVESLLIKYSSNRVTRVSSTMTTYSVPLLAQTFFLLY